MKEFLLTIVALIFINVTVKAQEFKPFSVGVDLGYSLSIDKTLATRFGFLFAVEPAYKITDKIEASLKYEGVVLIGTDENLYLEGARMGSWLVNGKYFLNTNDFRPWAGMGIGFFNIREFIETQDTIEEYYIGRKFGFAPRVGFQFRHLRFAVEYNAVLGEESRSQDYLGVKVGIAIGGGRK
ncbi:hypothetical protein OO013_14740 [Mangrovivirga sp. M17]|uniref:Outer membrane protein beta-barrel domain-containing protein n=1 Tax=Mangrovivirga halotolerans TaxID=2993936 RepID=A0ABT3RVF0_9BACT|nr:hypothetical protein [Mangrovivirga halotolerans]MCX2745135.1 hypothetical protein [Mangrovivirga halotolerans]